MVYKPGLVRCGSGGSLFVESRPSSPRHCNVTLAALLAVRRQRTLTVISQRVWGWTEPRFSTTRHGDEVTALKSVDVESYGRHSRYSFVTRNYPEVASSA